MLDKGLDAVPINPFVPESLGVSCLSSLSDLPNPAQTSISIVTQPSVTLHILQQAHTLGIFAAWQFIASINASYIHSNTTVQQTPP
ncbi:hypothetical protein FB45DRAFT_909382, partial [Roridomyces roridus]